MVSGNGKIGIQNAALIVCSLGSSKALCEKSINNRRREGSSPMEDDHMDKQWLLRIF